MDNSFVLTLDFGTSGMKMTLIDSSLTVVEVLKREYEFTSPKPGWAQIDPSIFTHTITETVRLMRQRRPQQFSLLQGMICCTQWKGLIPVDIQGNALHDAILWLDKRAQKQSDSLNDIVGSHYFTAADCIPKIVWLRENHPDIYENAYSFLEINSYITCFATGNMVIQETGHYARSYITEIQKQMDLGLQAAGIPVEKIPGILRSNEIAGTVTKQAASLLGLPEGLPVYGGLCDIPAVAIGSFAAGIGQSHLYFGTSGWLATVLPASDMARCKRISPFINDAIIRLDGLEAVGLGRKWALELLYSPEQIKDGEFIKMLDASILEYDSSRKALLSVPLLYSENPPLSENVFGTFWRMRASDTKRDFYHAVLEGLSFLIRVKVENLQDEFGYANDILLVSGGCAENRGWMQMLSDILQRCIQVIPDPQYVGAIGSAVCLPGCTIPELHTIQGKSRIYTPNEERSKRFNRKYTEFIKIFNLIVGNMESSEE